MLAMIKYIKAEKSDYEQLITVNSGNIKESEERLKRYNLSDIQIITRDDEKYLKSLSEAESFFPTADLNITLPQRITKNISICKRTISVPK